QQDYATIAQWTSNGLLLPMDDYVNDRTINLTDVPKGSIDGGRINGKLIALNLGNNSQAMMLDVDAFQKAGIALPPTTWTWEDFEKIATDIHTKLGITGGGPNLDDIQMWKSLYLGYGQWGFSADGKALGYTDDQMFIDYMTNDIEANKILLGERGVPISPKIADAIKPLLTPAQVETQDYLGIVSKEASPLPPPDPAAQTNLANNVYLPQLVDPVLLKQTPPESAVAQFRKDATALLAAP